MTMNVNYTITPQSQNQFTLYLKHGTQDTKHILYETIIHTLPHSFSFVDPETQELHFQTSSSNKISNKNTPPIQNLLDFLKRNRLSWEQCLLLIGFLSNQIQELEKRGYAILGFNLQDIVMIDERVFLLVNNEYLFPFQKKESNTTQPPYITLMTPLKKPYFSSPELLQLTKLPSKIHYKSVYYSLASLVVYCLLDEYLFKGNETKSESQIENILKPLYGTKMYWFLKRCFVSNPENRRMLFI